MILESSDLTETLGTFMQWGFVVIIIAIIIGVLLKWGLKKIFPSLVSLFYTLIPLYIVNTILVVAMEPAVLNKYSAIAIPDFGYYLLPPYVWDALFGMGMVDGRIELISLSVFFIVFLAPWLAWRTTLGIEDDDVQDKLFLKRLICACMLLMIMGIGLPNFSGVILVASLEITLLHIPLLVWIIIFVIILVIITVFIKIQKRKEHIKENAECELIDGEWVCDVEEK